VPASIPGAKRLIRELNYGDCQEIARKACQLAKISEVKELLNQTVTH
jgi:phosphoenolpyruvate-protein kinase (PTS system EI component)